MDGGCVGTSGAITLTVPLAGQVFDGMPHKRPGFDTSVWADIQPEILGIVLRFLPSLADRASVRSVCRHWRPGACSHDLLPPLPLLVLPKFRFSCLNSDGSLTPAHKAAMPTEVADDNVRCVGSSDDWLVRVRPSKHYNHADGRCFLVNAFSQLPRGSPSTVCFQTQHGIFAVVVSLIGTAILSWKLFMILSGGPSIFALELGEDKHGVNVSRVERCLTKPLLPGSAKNAGALRFNLVVWRGQLLQIFEYFNGYNVRRNLRKVRVFALDCSTHPYGLTEIYKVIASCGIYIPVFPCKAARRIEGDMIYFVKEYGINGRHDPLDPYYDTFVYNMRDGTTRPFADNLSPGNFGAPENKLSFPVWCFPSDRSSAN
ncbi:hypothetical protein PR202_gb12988 [Eleusine coracana subsp. coracana]|uniref:F-box domain-containing protein n=1 Tax=Eleusine coracana subsp. coracana TaxID=191504 RepID=A0AAV5ERC0_ELECO|nr:hypothetical protein PR202_gb12988 [Eleusine coracana subsp. coracana]